MRLKGKLSMHWDNHKAHYTDYNFLNFKEYVSTTSIKEHGNIVLGSKRCHTKSNKNDTYMVYEAPMLLYMQLQNYD